MAGRDKDTINRGGEKVSDEEVENFAYPLNGIELAAAVAMPDPVLGERVCLYVILAQGDAITLTDVTDLMNTAGVARFKLAERLIVVDHLPITDVGKLDKKAIGEDVRSPLSLGRPPITTTVLPDDEVVQSATNDMEPVGLCW